MSGGLTEAGDRWAVLLPIERAAVTLIEGGEQLTRASILEVFQTIAQLRLRLEQVPSSKHSYEISLRAARLKMRQLAKYIDEIEGQPTLHSNLVHTQLKLVQFLSDALGRYWGMTEEEIQTRQR